MTTKQVLEIMRTGKHPKSSKLVDETVEKAREARLRGDTELAKQLQREYIHYIATGQ